jgi:poly(hydroxyalkanoate) depolymerase family esterase
MMALCLGACADSRSATGAARGDTGGSFESHSYTNQSGTRTYKLYTPATDSGQALPLLVDLHGCSSNADEEARWSRFNELAEQFRVLVAYPEQDPDANGSRCWNWFLDAHQHRDAGEPSLIAGITRQVLTQRAVDTRRIYIAGISAGGAMANIMAVTYPDLYAAAMIYAGCQYSGFCFGTISPIPPEAAGETAYREMGAHARVVPVLVLQGDADPLVPYPNADIIVQQYLASGDWSDDGTNNGSIPREPGATSSGQRPGGRSYEVDQYHDAAGCLLAERWLVHGMGQQWATQSDGSPRDAALTDPLAPDLSTPAFEFLLSRAMPLDGTLCTGA